jgi:hypothetical protein
MTPRTETHTPLQVTAPIRALCKEINPTAKPVYVSVIPRESANQNDCFPNVLAHVEQHGGAMCLGWQIWEWENVLIEAEFHAVWLNTERKFIDVTPKDVPTRKILFLPDPKMTYEGKQVNNIRRPLRHDPNINGFIQACDEEFALKNKGERAFQHGHIELLDAEAQEYEDIQIRRMEYLFKFLPANKLAELMAELARA